ncbi:hypothetical protein K502DRAFT_323337 [Neoconidiobolus thromboides FSU 785]|nr:hypothetical protein K502DRAFT_323337 [Neoconidiobolus thromboides FSU 785]
MGIFAITGSTSVYISRPLLNNLFGLKGSLKEGPWSYRISSVLLGLPTYSLLLFTFSNLFGKNVYFYPILKRMWSRFLPKKWSNKLTMLK